MSTFDQNLKQAGISDDIIAEIMSVTYSHSKNEKQDNADFYAAALKKCDELLDFDTVAEAMFDRACSKGGYRLSNAKKIAKESKDKTLAEKLELLGQLKYMGHPQLTEEGDIFTGYCAGSGTLDNLKCSCWQLSGCLPKEGKMPLSYCLCCAGHFRYHYQIALGLKLRVKKVLTSVFNEPSQYCSFLLEIVNKDA
jgi:hypothetical protein